MDPFTIGVLFAGGALVIIALGGALLLLPHKSTRLLNEWFITIPVVRPGQHARGAIMRLLGGAIVGYGAWLMTSAVTYLMRV